MEIGRIEFFKLVMRNFPLKKLFTYKLPRKIKTCLKTKSGKTIRIVNI